MPQVGSKGLRELGRISPEPFNKLQNEAARTQERINRQTKRTRRSVGITTSVPEFGTPPPQETAAPEPTPSFATRQSVRDAERSKERRRRGFRSTFLTRGRLNRANTTKATALGA